MDREKFGQYTDRKRMQPKEEQYVEAGLLVSEMTTVDTEKAYAAVQKKIGYRSRFGRVYDRFSRIAAIFVFPLLVYAIWSFSGEKRLITDDQLGFQEITNPTGIRSRLLLPDGSNVWLNAESTIRYRIPFVRETREVELMGEAYFDVVKHNQSPFEVKFDQTTVRVLGTRFNVRNFPDETKTEVVLKEGCIHLQKGEGQIILKPDHQWIYDQKTNTAVVKTVDAEQYTAWHENRLVLNKTPMVEVAKQLERWYGIQVEIQDPALYKYKFTTVFENEPLNRVIELLEMSSPIQIKYVADKEESIMKISTRK